MKILACDTCLGALSAAVLDGERVLAHEFTEMVRGHAEELAPMVDRVMKTAGVALDALDRLAVTTGPGTFTGQRVGIAFMRAVALATKKPLIGITTTDTMAVEALSRAPAPWALAVADAKRGEVYIGALSAANESILGPALVPSDEAVVTVRQMAERDGAPALAGTAAKWMRLELNGRGIAAIDSGVRQPDSVFVARLATQRPTPSAPPKPLYLRAPDAKLPT